VLFVDGEGARLGALGANGIDAQPSVGNGSAALLFAGPVKIDEGWLLGFCVFIGFGGGGTGRAAVGAGSAAAGPADSAVGASAEAVGAFSAGCGRMMPAMVWASRRTIWLRSG